MDTRILLATAGLTGSLILLGQMDVIAGPDEELGLTKESTPGTGAESSLIPTGAGQPDVTVSRLGLTSGGSGSDDFRYWGTSSGIRAFSVASTSCNVGDAVAEWVSGASGNHPVIGQNMYRLLDGKFEHIGQSWLKHSFCAVSEHTCGSCQSGTGCEALGIGCADTYWSDLNDGASGGPKSEINPQGEGSGGTHTHPYSAPSGPTAIRGRLQISDADINAGGQNFVEVQYITHDELMGKRYNNASWRPVNLSLTNISGVGSGQGSVRFQEPGIMAWKENDPLVTILNIDLPDKGRMNLGYRVYDQGDGTWRYEYALHNLNSDRGGSSFSIDLAPGVSISSSDFHDVDYHSGEPYDGTDWAVTEGPDAVLWETEAFITNENANALRWGTLYNFRFVANTAPVNGVEATIGLFKPGNGGDAVTVLVAGPDIGGGLPCPADLDGVNGVDFQDLLLLLAAWGTDGSGADIADPTNLVDFQDLLGMLAAWGPCP